MFSYIVICRYNHEHEDINHVYWHQIVRSMEFFPGGVVDASIAIGTFAGFVGLLVLVVRYLGKKSDATTAALIAVIEKQRDEYRASSERLTSQLIESERSRQERTEALQRVYEDNKREILKHIDGVAGALQAEDGALRTDIELVKQDIQRLKRRRGNNI